MKEKQQIEKEYVNAMYNDLAPNVFADKIMAIFGKDGKETRTSLQNRSRWKYLQMVANILNDQGHTYNPIGTDFDVKFTKDLLYSVYWDSARKVMYPEKKGQLNTKEFSDLVDVVMKLFANVFEINIPFPNREQLIKREPPVNY
jgi:hypothetical protein